jgi:hypothetical protein
MERVFQSGPWLIDNFKLILKLAFEEETQTVPPDAVEIRTQIHQLPFGFMTEHIGILEGSRIGKFIKYDEYNNVGAWRKYMRVKVAMNVHEP